MFKSILRNGLESKIEDAVEKAIDNQSTHWHDKIKDHISLTIKSSQQKDVVTDYSKSYYSQYNVDRGHSGRRWR